LGHLLPLFFQLIFYGNVIEVPILHILLHFSLYQIKSLQNLYTKKVASPLPLRNPTAAPPTRYARCCPFCLAKQAWGKKAWFPSAAASSLRTLLYRRGGSPLHTPFYSVENDISY